MITVGCATTTGLGLGCTPPCDVAGSSGHRMASYYPLDVCMLHDKPGQDPALLAHLGQHPLMEPYDV
jgi:hypothetical protein